MFVLSTAALIRRAAAVVQDTIRICAQSDAIRMRGSTAICSADRTVKQSVVARAMAVSLRQPGLARAPLHAWLPGIQPLPLTPAMLLDIAADFRARGDFAATPESRFAFIDLAFRYTALAHGHDTTINRSLRLH